jgi:hypothetical protein
MRGCAASIQMIAVTQYGTAQPVLKGACGVELGKHAGMGLFSTAYVPNSLWRHLLQTYLLCQLQSLYRKLPYII